MKASDLVTVWGAPDNSRLTAKQYSFRLPVHVAAKVAALEEMYPTKSRTQLIADLLASALTDLEKAFPFVEGKQVGVHPDTKEKLYEDTGPAPRYRALANKHYVEIEKEIGNDSPGRLF